MEKIIERILFVNIPEVAMIIIMGIVLIKGFRIKRIKKIEVFKTVLSAVIISIILYFTRQYVSYIPVITLISTAIYAVLFKIIFKFNIRESIIGSTLSMIIVVLLETTFSPLMDVIVNNWLIPIKVSNDNIIIILTLMLRALHLMIMIIIVKFKLFFDDAILIKEKWSKLEKTKRVTIITMICLLLFSMTLATYSTQVFLKYNSYSSELGLVICTEIVLCLSIVLLNRTINYEKHKEIVNMKPEVLIEKIASNSEINELRQYQKIILKELNRIQLKKMEDSFKSYRLANDLFKFEIDSSLSDKYYDYTNFRYILDGVIKVLIKETNIIEVKMSNMDNYINILVSANEIRNSNVSSLEQIANERIEKTKEPITYVISNSSNGIIIDINISYKGGRKNE